jgi:hypothetical protein
MGVRERYRMSLLPFLSPARIFLNLLFGSVGYPKMGQRHRLRRWRRPRIYWCRPPAIRTEVQQRGRGPRWRDRRRSISVHGSGLRVHRGGYMVPYTPSSTATSVVGFPKTEATLGSAPHRRGEWRILYDGLDAGRGG